MNRSSEPPLEPSDADLLLKAGAGDKGAFQGLYRRLSKSLYASAYRFAGNQADAEEIMQETFLELWKQAPRYDAARAKPLTLATRILRCRAIDRIRMRTRRAGIATRSAEDILDFSQGGPAMGVADSADLSERAQTVREAIEQLPEDQRSTLQLAYFGGLSQSEIAAEQSLALGTVKSRIRRALDKLRRELEDRL